MVRCRTPDPLRELERLVDVGRDEDHNIGELLLRNAGTLGPLLRIDDDEIDRLADLPDGAVRERLRRPLARLREADRARRLEEIAIASRETAMRSRSVRSEIGRAHV